jgi:hypothetical protein
MKLNCFVLFLPVLFFFLSCHRKTLVSSPLVKEEIVVEPEQIQFIAFLMKEDTIIKLNSQVVNGTFKSAQTEDSPTDHVPLLRYKLLDASSNVLSQETMIHPLHKWMEYPDENNQFQRKKIDLKEAEFFIRIKKTKALSKIQFSEKLEDKWDHLITLKID